MISTDPQIDDNSKDHLINKEDSRMIDYPEERTVSSEIDESNSTEKMQTEDGESSGDNNIEQQEKNDDVDDLQNNNNKDVEQELLVAVDNTAEDDDAAAATAPNDDETSVNKFNNMADQDEQEQQQTTIEESRTSSHQSRGFLPLRASFRNNDQDEFVKNGARVKSVFTSSFRVVANGLSSTNNNTGDSNGDNVEGNNNNSSGSNGKRKISKTDFVHAQDLAQEKTEECMALKRVSNTYYCLILFLLKGGNSYHNIPT